MCGGAPVHVPDRDANVTCRRTSVDIDSRFHTVVPFVSLGVDNDDKRSARKLATKHLLKLG